MNTKYVANSKVELRVTKGVRRLSGPILLGILFLSLMVPSALAARQGLFAPGAAAEMSAPAVQGAEIVLAQAGACAVNPANVLANGSFESGGAGWSFFSNGSGRLDVGGPATHCSNAAHVTLTRVGTNMQLYQSSFSLKADTRYRLSFSAFSSTGNDMRVYVQQHTSPYASLGLQGQVFNLTSDWQQFSTEFTTTGFSGTTTNTRLRFWPVRYAENGDVYHFDNIVLEEIGGGSPPTATATPPPNATATPRPSATPTPGGGGGGGRNEMVVFDWNGPVTEAHRGFPNNTPPMANGNWITPVNYAQGTLEYRLEIRSQPQPQDMRIQLCFWQEKNGNNFGLESCGPQQAIRGVPGTVRTWSVNVQDMWKLGGRSIEWDRPRFRAGAAIKNAQGKPVSNFNGWNWNGENPKLWYPLNMRFTVVVVAKGSTFSGWDNYR